MRPFTGLLFVLLIGCSSSESVESAVAGELVYAEPLEDGNTFACATCHALQEPAADGLRRPGHPIGDAFARPSFKDGQLTDLREAVNTCVTEWMNAQPLAVDDPRWTALESFLANAAPAQAPVVDIQIVAPPMDLDGGDTVAGRAFFNGACVVCHGQDAEGTIRAPSLSGRELQPSYIADRVRTSGRAQSETYEGLTGGVMPFWGADRLSDAELLDVVAYVNEVSRGELVGPVEMPPVGLPPVEMPPVEMPPPTGCEATHPKVGQTAVLRENFHDVGGTAQIVDDCTIVIDDFTFDARGIDVQVYAGLGGDYNGGSSLSDNLIRSTPYAGEPLTITLPDGVTLDDLDGLSIWCVPVGVSFGDGRFSD